MLNCNTNRWRLHYRHNRHWAYLELKYFSHEEGDCAGGGEGDDPPVRDVQHTVEHQAETEPTPSGHHAVKHGAPDVVVNHLAVQLSVEILPSHQD